MGGGLIVTAIADEIEKDLDLDSIAECRGE
jgi:hypothetical protein